MNYNYKASFVKIYSEFNLSYYDIVSEIDFVIECLTGMTSKDFILGKILNEKQICEIQNVLTERVKTGRPIQQIVGKAFFAGDEFIVSKDTLIPRPETEFIIEKSRTIFGKNENINILDIGTGSGCIAIELAKIFPNSKITAVDICQETLDIATLNIEKYGLCNRITVYKSDLFETVNEKFDLIVSNPPYISFKEKESVQEDVFNFEPHRALFAEDEGLYFYKKIIKEAKNFLNQNGYIIFEIGINQSNSVTSIFEENNYSDISSVTDFNGIDRVICARYYQ